MSTSGPTTPNGRSCVWTKPARSCIRRRVGACRWRPPSRSGEDYEYERHGVANLFLAIEPLCGRRRVRVTDRRTKHDFAEQLRLLADEDYPDSEIMIVLVIDNLNTHGPGAPYEHFEPEEAHRLVRRFEWHYTPEHASWLNTLALRTSASVAECELSVLAAQCLDQRIPDKETLIREVAAWEGRHNRTCARIDW
jgi:DDE superfamily endonuclease